MESNADATSLRAMRTLRTCDSGYSSTVGVSPKGADGFRAHPNAHSLPNERGVSVNVGSPMPGDACRGSRRREVEVSRRAPAAFSPLTQGNG